MIRIPMIINSHHYVHYIIDPRLSHTRLARSVVGHVHWTRACDWHSNSVKAIPLMAAWHYNWAAAHAVQGEQVYLSCQNTVSKIIYPVPKVLALSPVVSLTLNNATDLKGMQASLWRLFALNPYILFMTSILMLIFVLS